MSSWERPEELRLARRLREVVAGLREATPHLVEAQMKAFEGMPGPSLQCRCAT